MSVDLLPHNEKAYEEVKKVFETKDRTAVIHPTGTGKSFIALKLIEENPNKKVVYISPSLPIIQQLEINIEKYGINPENIEILTYQRLNKMTKQEIEALNADYIILDEFHHCGAPEWGKVAYELLETNKNAKTLGLSATPLRYTVGGIRDMSEEIFDGSIASEMSLESAIAEGILNEPTYVTGVYEYENLIGDLERRIEEYRANGKAEKVQMAEQELRELKKHLEEAVTSLPDLLESSMPNKSGKYIVFCSSIEDMKRKIDAAPELFKKVNSNIDIMKVSSSDADLAQNEETIERFSNDSNPETLKLLFCVNMLNEGFHLEDIDGGIMMRATNSPTLYTQQFGRIVAAGKNQDTVLIDLVNNVDTIQNIIDFHNNLSKEKEKRGKSVKPFRVGKELRNIRDIVLRIEKLTSRRSNVIDANFASYLGISYEQAKEIIESNKDLLFKARETQYDNNGMVRDYELLNMFSQYRKAIYTAQHTRDEESEEYKKNLKTLENIREDIILKNMGLAKWIVDNIPGLEELDIEDKEQMAIPYLIQAVDTYNPRLKTSENTSLRFDEYAMVFIKTGIENELREEELDKGLEKRRADVESIYDVLRTQLEREPTLEEVASEVYRIICEKTINAQQEDLEDRVFLLDIKEKIEDYKNKYVRKPLVENNRIGNREKRIPIQQVEKLAQELVYGYIEEFDNEPMYRENYLNFSQQQWHIGLIDTEVIKSDLIKMIRFEIDRLYTKINRESLDNVIKFNIDSVQLSDTDKIEYTRDGFIQDGVYLDEDMPYMRDASGAIPIFEDQVWGEQLDLKERLKYAKETITEREQDILTRAIENKEKHKTISSTYGISGSAIGSYVNKAINKLRHPSRAKNFRQYYFENENVATFENISKSKRTQSEQYNENLDIHFQIQSGELWNIKLGDVVENEEVFQALNEAGMWNLQELAECSEHQLRNEYGFDEEMVEYITDTLERLGISIQEESEQELIGDSTIVADELKTESTQEDLEQIDEPIIDIKQEDTSKKDTLDLGPMKEQRSKCQMLEIRLQQMQEDLNKNKARLQEMQGMLAQPGMEIFKIQELAAEIIEIAHRIEEEQKVVDGLEIERIAEEQQLKDMKALAISEIENI